MLTLEDGCHIGDFGYLVTCSVTPQRIHIDPIRLGEGALLGVMSMMMPGSTAEKEAWLGGMSVIESGKTMEKYATYLGINPSVRVQARDPNTSTTDEAKAKPPSIIIL
eukprot:TRINITY_DN39065_c0_g1_i4.p1 TRINITY_DN39065_c0_g1~~TRINITY_DN39065_c0_g1_i4.p1  ORF type:complete len:108 (-),score=8.84 TRINITY_DN39065_c0_g1_i4:72-395(-)